MAAQLCDTVLPVERVDQNVTFSGLSRENIPRVDIGPVAYRYVAVVESQRQLFRQAYGVAKLLLPRELSARPVLVPGDQRGDLAAWKAFRNNHLEPAEGLYLQARVARSPGNAQAPVQFAVAVRHGASTTPP